MCDPVTASVVAIGGGVMSAREKAKAEGAAEDARRKGQLELVKQLNAANADSRLEMKDKGDQAKQQLTEVNLTSLRNKGMLNAAIGESGLSGNSMNRLKRVSGAESSREKMSVVDNYVRDYQSLFADQVSMTENTKSKLRSSQPIHQTSNLAHALNIASGGMGAYNSAKGPAKKGE